MARPEVKGDLFRNTLDYVTKRWGKVGLEKLTMRQEAFLPQGMYPFTDFCDMLSKIEKDLANGRAESIWRLGKEMIVNDVRWQAFFRSKDPNDIFTSTKRQDSQYLVGTFKTERKDIGHITIEVEMWKTTEESCRLWNEFYKGRLQGVLDLTNHKGEVEYTPTPGKEGTSGTFHVKWK